MAKRRSSYGDDTPTPERPEFPKPLVRLKAEPGGYGCEVRMVGDSDAESGATAEGFAVADIPTILAGFQEYPKWLYHGDGRRQVVYTQAEADALEGFVDAPVDTEPDPKAELGVPPPVGDAVAVASKNRPPVPADRG